MTLSQDEEARVFESLGRIAAAHASMHHVLEITAWRLCRIDEGRGSIVTGEMSTKALIECVVRLAGHVDPARDFEANFAHRLRQAEQDRNRYLHSSWTFEVAPDHPAADLLADLGLAYPGVIREKYVRRKGKIISEIADVDRLRSVSDEMERLVGELYVWLKESFTREEFIEYLRDGFLDLMEKRRQRDVDRGVGPYPD